MLFVSVLSHYYCHMFALLLLMPLPLLLFAGARGNDATATGLDGRLCPQTHLDHTRVAPEWFVAAEEDEAAALCAYEGTCVCV
jgi:hypothetical protein